MSEFKFNLGDMVTHVTHGGKFHKLSIIGRYFLESAYGKEEKYVTSCYEMGQIVRQSINAEELVKSEED